MRNIPVKDMKFIFYIPGSMGSLLSLLIKSQIEKNFVWQGLDGNTAHNYKKLPFSNTHGWADYIDFKKNNKELEQHLVDNYNDNDSLVHQISFPGWLNEFEKIKHLNLNLILCYVEDYKLKLFNYYAKKQIVLSGGSEHPPIENPVSIKKSHPSYKTFTYIASLNWQIELEKPHMNTMPTIKIENILQKDFRQLSKVIQITNASLLDEIIDLYNQSQDTDYNKLPEDMKKYLKKYHNSI